MLLSDYDKIIYERLRRSSPQKEEFTRKEIEALKKAMIIQASKSSYASAIVVVNKKGGELRMCIDYRELNRITISDKHPLPRTTF